MPPSILTQPGRAPFANPSHARMHERIIACPRTRKRKLHKRFPTHVRTRARADPVQMAMNIKRQQIIRPITRSSDPRRLGPDEAKHHQIAPTKPSMTRTAASAGTRSSIRSGSNGACPRSSPAMIPVINPSKTMAASHQIREVFTRPGAPSPAPVFPWPRNGVEDHDRQNSEALVIWVKLAFSAGRPAVGDITEAASLISGGGVC